MSGDIWVLIIALAIVETVAIYMLTKKMMALSGLKKIIFYIVVLLYELFGVSDKILVNHGNLARLLLLGVLGVACLLFSRKTDIWKPVWFFSKILIFRFVCQLHKFIFLTVYCKADIQKVEYYMGNINQTILIFYILFCIPGFLLTRYIWNQFLVCHRQLIKITSLIMFVLFFATDFFSEWIQILAVMPTVLLLFTLFCLCRIAYQNAGEYKLNYYKELEEQVKDTDRELLEIRKEVEKFYGKTDEGRGYTKQLLQKLDEIKEIK